MMAPALGYLTAKRLVTEAGFGQDIDWAEGLAFVKPDAHYVVRETAWVILNSGFRYQVARKLWPGLLAAFHDFEPARVDEACLPAGLAVLRHPGKLGAIVQIAETVRRDGHLTILELAKTPPKLTRLPWIGKITCWHLAKVLGIDAVKPDVHLVRAAVAAGYAAPLALCQAIQGDTGDRLTVIDSVLWRYGEQKKARGWADWPALWGGATS